MKNINSHFHPFLTIFTGILLLVFLIDFLPTAASLSQPVVENDSQQIYIVLFEAPTVVQTLALQDDVSMMNVHSISAKQRQQSLLRQQNRAIDMMSQMLKRPLSVPYHYTFALNGIAIVLTRSEAAQIKAQPDVSHVFLSQNRVPQTDASPGWIGASGLWDGSKTGGVAGTKGEGIIIGIIDTGINMDHPSFAAVGGDGYVHTNPNGTGIYLGHCTTQPETYACNDKLIGAYSWPEVGDNPEDYTSHGSNVAGIAAGNFITVPYSAPTTVLTPTLSGVAPHANIISYDVCESTSSSGQSSQCPDFISIRAIEQAILDDVDVLNFSIGGIPTNPWEDALSLAFLSAREAGIFVATAAGNNGPNPNTILAPANSPWLTTVSNVTHNGRFNNTITAISGGIISISLPIIGSSITGSYGPAPIVLAPDDTCQTSFPANTWTQGEIVLCRYSSSPNARTKANRVLAGGAGGVLVDAGHDVFQALGIDRFNLPGINILQSDADELAAWLSSGSDHIAEIDGTLRQYDASYGDEIYFSSSRGPSAYIPDVLKPNVSAPGVLIWAAGRTTASSIPPELSFYRGTSQASPHVAGTAVLLKALHPDWTPAEVESALMMTALTAIREYDGSDADAFTAGAGRIDLTAVSRAGLVMDESGANFRAANPVFGQDASQLNLAALTTANCGSSCVWTRQLRNALPITATWEVDITQPVTAVLTVTPTVFTLLPGTQQIITVTATADNLPIQTWDFGTLLLSESGQQAPDAHLPVTLKRGEETLLDYIEINTREDAGSHLLTKLQAPGITNLTATNYGLVRGTITETHIAQDEILTMTLNVPTDSKQLLVEIISSSAVDIDLFVQKSGAARGTTCSSISSWSSERCFIFEPDAGDYEISVQRIISSGLSLDTLEIGTAVVPDQIATNSWVTGPLGQPMTEPFDLRFFWQEPAIESGEYWYGGMALGTEPGSPEDLGFVPVVLRRHPDAIDKIIDPTSLTLASPLTTTITMLPNVTPVELRYVLTETIPSGLTVTAVNALSGEVSQIDDSLRWEVALPPMGAETAVLQYQATANANLCNRSATSSLNIWMNQPGSQSSMIDIALNGICYQSHLPVIYQYWP